MGYVYKHVRLDKNEPFYIGISDDDASYKRAFSKSGRNRIWKSISKKTDFVVEIIIENLTVEELEINEKLLIKIYGRIDLGTGILANMTDGGLGGVGTIKSDIFKKSVINNGKNAMKNLEHFLYKARQKHGDRYDYSLVEYKGSKTPVKIICSKHNIFEQIPSVHYNSKIGCDKCASEINNKIISDNHFKDLQKHIGIKYNNLLIKELHQEHHNKATCLCDCGNYKKIKLSAILSNHIKSCGCIRSNKRGRYITESINKNYNSNYFDNITPLKNFILGKIFAIGNISKSNISLKLNLLDNKKDNDLLNFYKDITNKDLDCQKHIFINDRKICQYLIETGISKNKVANLSILDSLNNIMFWKGYLFYKGRLYINTNKGRTTYTFKVVLSKNMSLSFKKIFNNIIFNETNFKSNIELKLHSIDNINKFLDYFDNDYIQTHLQFNKWLKNEKTI